MFLKHQKCSKFCSYIVSMFDLTEKRICVHTFIFYRLLSTRCPEFCL